VESDIVIDEKLTTNMIIGCSIILLGTAMATGLLSLQRAVTIKR
jgi:hypothetical protein